MGTRVVAMVVIATYKFQKQNSFVYEFRNFLQNWNICPILENIKKVKGVKTYETPCI